MQKLLRRTAQAERQVARRKAKIDHKKEVFERKDRIKRQVAARKEASKLLIMAKRNRFQDYWMGPCTPRRDLPWASYGAIPFALYSPRWKPTKEHLHERCRWAGGPNRLCIKPGDRAVVMEGHWKGEIATILKIDKRTGMVSLSSETMKQNVQIPRSIQALVNPDPSQGRVYVQQLDVPMPISAIRLVYPLPDAETGKLQDVIIRELRPFRFYRDKPTGKKMWERVVPGPEIQIPWPKEEEEEFEDEPADTLRIDAEVQTFVPTLLTPPMPLGVIDELRGRYSKFRTRHTDEYVAEKEAEEAARKGRIDLIKEMMTPRQELNAKLRRERKAKGQPQLTDDMLARIGEIMLKNRHRLLDGSRIAEVVRAEEDGPGSKEAADPAPPSQTEVSPETIPPEPAPDTRAPPDS